MKCPSCEKENPEDAQFCNGCGKPFISKVRGWSIIRDLIKEEGKRWNKKRTLIVSVLGILAVIAIVWILSPNKTVKIGNQIWMTKNLNVDHYRNGDPIPEVANRKQWSNLTTGAWCYYNNDPENGKKYGKLYNWYAVNDPRGLAPKGWHIPSNEEFRELAAEVGYDGNALKAIGQGTGTNTSGFSSLFAGNFFDGGYFFDLDYYARFWSSTEFTDVSANCIYLYYDASNINFFNSDKLSGYSVRCVKD